MGKITEEILALIKRQIDERGIVVWYDPERVFSRLLPQLSFGDVPVVSYDDGFFKLREKIEPFLEFVDEQGQIKQDADIPPKLVIYVPFARGETEYALIEAETAGIVMEPGSPRQECNTKLSLAVERVFSKIAPAKANNLARQAEDGLLTIEELDRIADEAGQPTTGLLQVVFGPLSVDEIFLQFAASDAKDGAIIEKNALPELVELIKSELELEGLKDKDVQDVRKALRRYLLLNEFLAEMTESLIPESLRRLPRASKATVLDLIRHICRVWRNRVDLKAFYCDAAESVEKEVNLAGVDIPSDMLLYNETFEGIDINWLEKATLRLVENDPCGALKIISVRMELFWAKERPRLQIEWKVLEAAAQVLRKANEIENDLKKHKKNLDDLIKAYAVHAEPWMLIDRFYRLMESRYAGLEMMEATAASLEKVINHVRTRYAEVLQEMNVAYSNAALQAEFRSTRFRPQSLVFRDVVRPLIEKKEKIAYFLVDALRYEMAAEILEGMDKDYVGTIDPFLGQLPGITMVGMGALLPGSEKGIAVERKSGGINVLIGDRPLGSHQARLEWLKEKAGVSVASFRLGETLKLTPKRKKEIESAKLIVVTSQEIDRMGEESGEEEEARLYIEGIPDKIRRSIRSLARAGIRWFVVVADHGFHLVDSLDPGMSMDGPGGDTLELHSRAWIGLGGVAAEGFLRVKANDLGLGGTLEFAFPRGLGVFRVRGGVGSYFHGGISPQEHIIPAIVIEAKGKVEGARSVLGVKLSMAKDKITNRIFTVTVEAETSGIFQEEGRRVQVEVVSDKEEIGKAVAAGYEYDESRNEIVVKPGKPNVVTLMLQRGMVPSRLTIQIVDAQSQIVLDSIKDIPVELAI